MHDFSKTPFLVIPSHSHKTQGHKEHLFNAGLVTIGCRYQAPAGAGAIAMAGAEADIMAGGIHFVEPMILESCCHGAASYVRFAGLPVKVGVRNVTVIFRSTWPHLSLQAFANPVYLRLLCKAHH